MTSPSSPAAPNGEHTSAHRPATQISTEPVIEKPQSFGDLVASLSHQISTLVNGEIELTKLKLKAKVTSIGIGGGLLAGAAVFALYLLGWVFHTIEVAIAVALPQWAAALIVTGIILVIILILALLGVKSLKESKKHQPNPKAGIEKSVDAVKKGLEK
ncbi:phage holin family protein [Schaalia sp. ZJ405]|uniref:phage holin family protein n=1 Tax=unclassified Schaalia TaxID=2691889 RepID=UPI0013ED2534|nr:MULTISPECIES: phage holin family protein [unclassified Schaalia]QPK81170.1 phage holin family protein [Schaalia sp. ZJ405]